MPFFVVLLLHCMFNNSIKVVKFLMFMKKLLHVITVLCFAIPLFAATGDTTTVRVFNAYHMNTYGNHSKKALLPSTDKKYQKVWLKLTLGCLSNGQCEWDYTVKLYTRERTGVIDSNLRQAPYLRVNGTPRDSVMFSRDTTWVTSFNATTLTTDSVPSAKSTIVLYNNANQPLTPTDTIIGFAVNYWKYYYNINGAKQDSVWVGATEVIRQRFTPYYEKFEVINNLELGRFISPYAVNFPKSFKYDYVYDVTDYIKYLTANGGDSTELRIVYEGYSYGFTATWDLMYVEGTPHRDVIEVKNIYNGYYNYGQAVSIENALNAKTFSVPAGTKRTKARIIITGHGGEQNQNCAEFCPKYMYLKLNGSQIAEQLVWKDDCGSTPIIAQPGTWIYNRANWCPGERIRNFDYDLNVNAGSTNTIDLDLEQFTANGAAGYNIALQLIYYKDANFETDASVEDIIAPTKNFWYNRINPVCKSGKIKIKNWGSTPLTSAQISYQIDNGDVFTQNWTGTLNVEQEQEINLPELPWPANTTDKIFKVWLSKINGADNDGNSYNNVMHTPIDLPIVLPNQFIVETRTNNVPQQNRYTLTDENGNVVMTKTFSAASTMHRDTFNLKFGCYTLRLTDEGNNGLGWWAAASEGNGMFRIVSPPPVKVLRTFNIDFGTFIELNFRVQYKVGEEEIDLSAADVQVYPVPAQQQINVSGVDADQLVLTDVTGRIITSASSSNTITIGEVPNGIYFLTIITKNKQQIVKKVQVQQ